MFFLIINDTLNWMFNYLFHTYLDKSYTLRPTVHYSGQAVQQKRLKIIEFFFFFLNQGHFL